jgi:uncharacterized repeat protein (TIGR03803 family)
VVSDKAGNLYGTTSSYFNCGENGFGTIFKVDSMGKKTTLHNFAGYPSDGAYPFGGHLVMDKSGNLYGVTISGGAYGAGILYKLSRNGTLTVLHNFGDSSSPDGCFPHGSVLLDTAGDMYGTTYQCGSNNYGTIWKVNRKGKETILHNFAGGMSDGCNPDAGVAGDSKGNLYGVTEGCGAISYGYGTLYKLSARNKLTLLHSFGGVDGASPIGEVLRTTNGSLYGTTSGGGTHNCGGSGCGTVWKYVP